MTTVVDTLPADLRPLIVGTTQLDGGPAEPTDVIDIAVERFFADHRALREAAVAERYATSGVMTTGRAADLADCTKGPEVERMLHDHGVQPLVGPMSDERADEVRETNRALYATDDSQPAADDDEETAGQREAHDDDDGETADRETVLAALSTDSRTLVRGAARVDGGLGDEHRVVERALRRFFRRHDDLRSAALDAADRPTDRTNW
ncbi:MAG: hypothetical protein ABEI99_02815 [Halobaculum sp.]